MARVRYIFALEQDVFLGNYTSLVFSVSTLRQLQIKFSVSRIHKGQLNSMTS